ncbi:hypothetical protein [Allokutzneria oryzae]|uniref:Integrase n=1 Tax=Allokutzneria oryzae TaxID=1378989 RepID=A0ABV5ZUK8_9PSEU
MLVERPYDLRHACLSMWLLVTGDLPLVAQWAGNSVAVLQEVYAQVLDGQDAQARKKITAAFDAR